MSKKTEELVEQLSGLTILEMSELKKALEEKWDVTAAAPAAVMAAPVAGGGEGGGEAAAEATDFQIILDDAGAKKIGVIKVVREATGLGLKEAKELVESAPKPIKDSAPKAEAEEIKKKIEEAGGKASLKGL